MSREDAEDEVGVLCFAGIAPGFVGFAEISLEAISRDVLGEAELGGFAGFAVGGEGLAEEVADAVDDLADAGLGDFEFFGDLAGGGGVDDDSLVGEEIAGGGR